MSHLLTKREQALTWWRGLSIDAQRWHHEHSAKKDWSFAMFTASSSAIQEQWESKHGPYGMVYDNQ